MARKGLGKGLDSLIPDIYNEDFDSNSTQSLEDMLGDDITSITDIEEENKEQEVQDESPQDDETPEELPQDENSEEISEEDDLNDHSDGTEVEDSEENPKDFSEEDEKKIEEEVSTQENIQQEETVEVEEPQDETVESEDTQINETPEEVSQEEIAQEEIIQEEEEPPKTIDYNPEHVEEVKKIVDKNPRITLWSSRSSAVLRYLRKTEPEFSISKEASKIIGEAISKKYPEIWALFDEEDD